MKVVIVISTAGSVLKRLVSVPYFKERISYVVSDRECLAIANSKNENLNTIVLPSKTGLEFCDSMFNFFEDKSVDLFVSFYTKLIKGKFLEKYSGKIINLHPSILPACPGMDGFGDTIKSGSKFVGSTVHFIDAGMDTGLPIIQAARPYCRLDRIDLARHQVFLQQCKSLLQVVRWLEEGRITGSTVLGAEYEIGEYSPNLDFDLAINFK
jgi:phosphoribosylglycinamide formyltransferase 1